MLNANYKLHALRRIRKYLVVEKAKLLGNAFIDSQVTSAPLIWMFFFILRRLELFTSQIPLIVIC